MGNVQQVRSNIACKIEAAPSSSDIEVRRFE